MGSENNIQQKSPEWLEQWSLFQDNERFLFEEWIAPVTYDDFKGKTVLECGCGGGQHTSFMAPHASRIVAVDLNTAELARERNREFNNVEFAEGDIATINFSEKFDIVICIGVIHHTDDPDKSFDNIYKNCKPGGRVIIWTYSAEGNELVKNIVEPIRKIFLRRMPRPALKSISAIITALLYAPVYTVYKLKFMRFLPYYEYFENFRRISFARNLLNVFDKLNAPQTRFTTYEKCREWFSADKFEPASISINKYKGVSYSLTGIKKTID